MDDKEFFKKYELYESETFQETIEYLIENRRKTRTFRDLKL